MEPVWGLHSSLIYINFHYTTNLFNISSCVLSFKEESDELHFACSSSKCNMCRYPLKMNFLQQLKSFVKNQIKYNCFDFLALLLGY